jgi:quercetin dioxygenase-like cupin family protein
MVAQKLLVLCACTLVPAISAADPAGPVSAMSVNALLAEKATSPRPTTFLAQVREEAPEIAMKPVAPSGGIGVSNAELMNGKDVRVLRVDVAPGGTRYIHTHDDVRFHLFVPVNGSIRLDLENQAPISLTPWQSYYFQQGTRHGFTNTGSSTITILEVFVK